MGRVYTFTCPRCEYRAHVSGGTDDGYHCVTRTILCRDCRALYDVTVRVRVTEETAPSLKKAKLLPTKKDYSPPMLLFGQPARTKWLDLKLQCPVSADHRIQVWNSPGKCPHCAAYLEQDVLPYRIWD